MDGGYWLGNVCTYWGRYLGLGVLYLRFEIDIVYRVS